MESINLNNYEAFFLDHLEGNLSDKGEQALYAFLNLHPTLQEEFAELTGSSFSDLGLSPDSNVSISKESLKADPTIISALTIDQWMVNSVENKLSHSENLSLLNYISKNKMEAKFMAYQATILSPNTLEVYGDKSNLKRKAATVIPLWMKLGTAAAAIALLVFFLNPSGQNEVNLAEENPTFIESISEPSLGREFYASNPRDIQINSTSILIIPNQVIIEKELIVKDEQPVLIDSSLVIPKIEDEIVDEKMKDSTDKKIVAPNLEPEFNIAINEQNNLSKTIEEEPYKIITKAASNVTNRNVSFTRTLNTESDEYVAYHFKIGKFEFDRKKRSK